MYSSGRGTSASSSAQIVPGTLSRIGSQTSMREPTTRSVANPVYLATPNTDFDLYAQMEREQHLQEQHDRIEREYQYQQQQKQQQLTDNGTASVKITRSIPINTISKESEFDNYSFTLNDDRSRMTTESSSIRHDRYDMMEHNSMYQHGHYNSNNDMDPPYIIKTSANLGSMVTGTAGGISQYSNDQTLKGIYRAVEYTKSPRIERVRIKNSEEFDNFEHHHTTSNDYMSRKHIIDSNNTPMRITDMDNNEYNHLQYRTPASMNSEHDEKTFVVKLFPVDEHEKEVQEMTMFVESNEQHTRKY